MKYDFSKVENVEDFVAVPDGCYVCRVAEVRERIGDDGVQRWSVRWEVEDGPFAGRTAAWDNLSWSEKGVRRVKAILERLGYSVQGILELDPIDLIGRRAAVTVFAQEYQDPLTGRKTIRSKVPFLGYQAVESAPQVADDTPF